LRRNAPDPPAQDQEGRQEADQERQQDQHRELHIGLEVAPQVDRHVGQLRVAKIARNTATLDARLKRMVEKPTMVGLAVGIVENGRITFLNGYGETLEGSGEKVTPETVFRWASVSKGVAATMVAKLAEEGKLSLNAPVANYAPDLKLPGRNEYRRRSATCCPPARPLPQRLRQQAGGGAGPELPPRDAGELNSICPPGTCWSYQNVAYDASSEMVAGSPACLRAGGRALSVRPIGMTSASVTWTG
jgi:beta-lactamase class C